MKAGDLLHRDVFDSTGTHVGRSFDLEATRTGPLVSEAMGNALQLSAVLVGPRAFLLRLGFKRREIKGPLGVSYLMKHMHGSRVRWDQISAIEDDRILLKVPKDELAKL
jgi:sporulation protein YlmC with PRC-barrel domain